MNSLRNISEVEIEWVAPVLVIGGGACGLAAALAASEGGAEVLVVERDKNPTGNTSLSQGLIPAPNTRLQRESGIADSPEAFAHDIMAKAAGVPDPAIVALISREAGPTVDWLIERHGVVMHLVTDFLYPGHSYHRMHGPLTQSGRDLEGALLNAAARVGVDILTEATAEALLVDDRGTVRGVAVRRPDGAVANIGCEALILACNGFGGSPELLQQYAPSAAGLLYTGHRGNDGTAIRFGAALGAATADMNAYQGHGSVVSPSNILLTWAVVTEGGIQVNGKGERFGDESVGYSGFAGPVERQPGGFAWSIFDSRCEKPALAFQDYQDLLSVGAIKAAESVTELAAITSTPAAGLIAVLQEIDAAIEGKGADRFGRRFEPHHRLSAPFRVTKTVGGLFHTQGGLVVDAEAHVLDGRGARIANVFAGGGAARGISGRGADGYIAGNGLVTALVLGRAAGRSAAKLLASRAAVGSSTDTRA